MTGELISTAQAAELLGVQPATVYSYVTRGILKRAEGSTRHDGSSFFRSEVIALRDSRLRKRSGLFELDVETAITRIDPDGHLSYRGHDATALATDSTYESVAEILWETGELDWSPTDESVNAGTLARRSAPGATPAARARLAVAILAARSPGSEVDAPRAAVAAINAAVHAVGEGPSGAPPSVRLAAALSNDPATSAHPVDRVVPVVVGAMVLLADHEMATSTVAARVATSTGTCVLDALVCGLSAMPGPRHAQVSNDAVDLLQRYAAAGRSAINDAPERIPGFGHIVYAAPDPRATALLGLLAPVAPDTVELVDRLSLDVLRQAGQHPNIDLALAAVELGIPLSKHAGETIFTIARIAGMAAHCIEEQGRPLRFRPRGDYTGPN